MSPSVLSVDEIVAGIRRETTASRRRRLSKAGGSDAYLDVEAYETVEEILRRADERDRSMLLLPELVDRPNELSLEAAPRISSHRPLMGPVLMAIKRRLLMPLNRWLLEYVSGNFRRQQEINQLLYACVEELAIEVARLRRERAAE